MTGQGKTPFGAQFRALAGFAALHAKRQARAMADSREQEWVDRELGDVELRHVADSGLRYAVGPNLCSRSPSDAATVGAAEPVRLEGVWTRDGFIATVACGARPEYATPSAQVENSTQPLIGASRGLCNSFPERGGTHD